MTFSDKRVVDLVRARMVPVWESVAPVKVAVFDLGDGRSVRGTVGGEIAIYFCRPDGKVFDILPALQSPKATLEAIRTALDFYDKTGATDAAIVEYHYARFAALERAGAGARASATAARREQRAARMRSGDEASRALAEMSMSKTGVVFPEPIVVVEPGGLEFFKREVHARLAGTLVARTPEEWKKEIFEDVLDQKLVGGVVEYDPTTLEPMSLLED